MPTVGTLNQRHPSSQHEQNERLLALYKGGEAFKKHLDEFLPSRPKEPPTQYTLRKKEHTYRNYVGPIVDYFGAMLFSSPPRASIEDSDQEPAPYYAAFHEDCDGTGTDLLDFAKASLTDAMVMKTSWVWLRHPVANDGQARTLAEFEELGLGDTLLTRLTDEEVLDWETDDAGLLDWVVIKQKSSKRTGLDDKRSDVTITWHHVQRDRTDVYRLTHKKDVPPAESTEVPLVETIAHRYGAVPLVCLDLPEALWVANRLENPQLSHFRLSNMQMWGMSKTCYAMPVFKLESADEKPDMGAGYGIFIGMNESLEWAAPPVDCYDALGNEIKSYKDEIYRIAQTMSLGVENNAAAVGRSGESKMADARATSVVMMAFARATKEFLERIYDFVSRARGEKLKWSIDGMDDFDGSDVMSVVAMLEQLESAGGIPSKTFQVEVKSRIAESVLPDLAQDKKAAIRKEIEDGIPDQSADAVAKRDEARMNAISGSLRKESPKQFPQDQAA